MTHFLGRQARAAKALCLRFSEDDNGATSIEYGLIVSLIFLAIVGAVRSMMSETQSMYSEIESAMS